MFEERTSRLVADIRAYEEYALPDAASRSFFDSEQFDAKLRRMASLLNETQFYHYRSLRHELEQYACIETRVGLAGSFVWEATDAS